MSLFEDVMQLAVQMPMNERERLGRALGLKIEGAAPDGLLRLEERRQRMLAQAPQGRRVRVLRMGVELDAVAVATTLDGQRRRDREHR